MERTIVMILSEFGRHIGRHLGFKYGTDFGKFGITDPKNLGKYILRYGVWRIWTPYWPPSWIFRHIGFRYGIDFGKFGITDPKNLGKDILQALVMEYGEFGRHYGRHLGFSAIFDFTHKNTF